MSLLRNLLIISFVCFVVGMAGLMAGIQPFGYLVSIGFLMPPAVVVVMLILGLVRPKQAAAQPAFSKTLLLALAVSIPFLLAILFMLGWKF